MNFYLYYCLHINLINLFKLLKLEKKITYKNYKLIYFLIIVDIITVKINVITFLIRLTRVFLFKRVSRTRQKNQLNL